MWKLSNLDALNTLTLYTPPAYVNRSKSPSPLIYKEDNTVENISNLIAFNKVLTKVQFKPITDFAYKDLTVNTYITRVSGDDSYSFEDISNFSIQDSYTFEDSLYQSNVLEPLLISALNEDLYIDVTYDVSNITSFKNIAIFTADNNLESIQFQQDSDNPAQYVTLDFIKQSNLTPESLIKFNHRYKIYHTDTNEVSSILNTSVRLTKVPLLVFNHSLENYDELELLIYKDKVYKRLYNLESVYKLLNTRTHYGYIINKDYISLIIS